MAFFLASSNPQLYVAPATGDDKGFAAFLLPAVPAIPQDGYDVSQALTDTALSGSFILSAYTPDLSTKALTDAFTGQLLQLLGQGRYIIWITDINNFSATSNTIFLNIAGDGSSTINGLTFPLVSTISLQLQNNMPLSPAESCIVLGNAESTPRIQFAGPAAPSQNISNATQGVIPLSGPYRGCIDFSLYITRSSLASGFSWGFQMLIPLENNPNQTALAEYLPLADGQNPADTDALGFNITVDPTDIFNLAFDYTNVPGTTLSQQYNSRRTAFNFTGTNQDQSATLLNSYYFTVWGSTIQLTPVVGNTGFPARLLFNNGEQYSANAQKSHLAPEGDFTIILQGPAALPLQCGLQGTEFFTVSSGQNNIPGDTIRFIGNQPAYAPVFPLPLSSPLTAPVNPDAPLLNTQYRTSWCTVLSSANNPIPAYVAQPKGSALFGNGPGGGSSTTLIGHSKPSFSFKADDIVLFPMLPYTAAVPDPGGNAAFSQEDIENFEKLIVSPIRKKNINSLLIAAQKQSRSERELKKARLKKNNSDKEEPEPVTDASTVTTPSGLIADLEGTGSNQEWKAINLAQNKQPKDTGFTRMYFANPDDALIQAFQTSDQFLVIANKENLGETDPEQMTGNDPAFYNEMFIGDWSMKADTGTRNKYNDYNNVIIVKGRKGKLYDPADPENSLVTNWQKWTDKDVFASPSTLDAEGNLQAPDPSQLVILSQWLQTYFADASTQTDTEYFGNFNTIAKDDNWTGILILAMNIADLPANLSGILSGVRFPKMFRAHHFGINITPVEQGVNGPESNSPSSMFGLIYYNDPDFAAQDNPQPIQPDLSETYDFILLDLKVLFENTAVKSFQSYAQLTTNAYFGSTVDHMGSGGNTYNTMLLKGALQFKGDEAIYSLSTEGVNTFYFDSPVVNKVEVSNTSFSTIGTNDKGELVSWFAINGFWDFKKLVYTADQGTDTTDDDSITDFDIFSFGSDGNDEMRKGLIFNGLGIQMVSPPYIEGQTDPLPKVMTFDTSVMTFDQGRSTPRPDSIYVNFALDLQNLVQGSTDTTPQGKDYLTVITDLKVTPIDGTPWLGLSYQLNMGTPGALAGNVGLTSTLLTAWDPTASDDGGPPPVLVGIKLPGTGGGAKLISLQSVLKLSIGQIRLSFAVSETSSSFLLMFTEIALKFLGLLKIPPNGSTLFYLFGNPQSGGKASGLGWYAMYKKDDATSNA